MGPFFVVEYTPILQLLARILQAHKPMCVQTFRSEFGIKRLNVRIISGLAWPREVENDATLIGPKIHIPRDKFAAIIDPD
jgi:hypothetical protein